LIDDVIRKADGPERRQRKSKDTNFLWIKIYYRDHVTPANMSCCHGPSNKLINIHVIIMED